MALPFTVTPHSKATTDDAARYFKLSKCATDLRLLDFEQAPMWAIYICLRCDNIVHFLGTFPGPLMSWG